VRAVTPAPSAVERIAAIAAAQLDADDHKAVREVRTPLQRELVLVPANQKLTELLIFFDAPHSGSSRRI
jgi:hypothetical protein